VTANNICINVLNYLISYPAVCKLILSYLYQSVNRSLEFVI